MANDYTIASVRKALNVLKQFNSQRKEMTLTELSVACDIGKSSMLRLLASLESEGFVKYNEETKKYRLGIVIFNLANSAYEFTDIRMVAAPILKAGAAQSQLLIHLAVEEDGKVVVIDKVWPSAHFDMIALISYVGGTVPIHCTGVGKVLAAYADNKKFLQMMKNCDFKKYTENTITDSNTFAQVLQQVRKNGYAFNDCEHEPYLRCITRPIYDREGKVIAALSLSGLKDVITDEKMDYYLTLSSQICQRLSAEFGYEQLSQY